MGARSKQKTKKHNSDFLSVRHNNGNDDDNICWNVVQLNVCKMVRSRKKGFIRRSDYAEVRVKADTTYQEVAEASVLQLQSLDSSSSDEDAWSGEAVLLRANGTVIVNRPIETTSYCSVPWDIGSYMKTFSFFVKTGVPVKLGVGFVVKVNKV